ncbi:MAG: hypothetical protein AB1640_11985 [bacterium]
MYPEPTVPFYVLSVYVPLVLVAYLAIFLTLSAVVRCFGAIAAALHGHTRRGVSMTPEPRAA